MKVVTEIELREQYKKNSFDTYQLRDGERLTPAASQFLNERMIKVVQSNTENMIRVQNSIAMDKVKKLRLKDLKPPEDGYICFPSGKVVSEKPEYYTHLKGRILVPKNHPRIKFRGTLDMTESSLICCINQIRTIGCHTMESDLIKILEYLQRMMRAEVLDEELPFIEFNGWSDEDIREYSHYPDKYFGVKHILPSAKYGQAFAEINRIRAMVRQLEVAGIDAFYNEEDDECERPDIILALNRLSSLIYIIICEFMGGQYKIC